MTDLTLTDRCPSWCGAHEADEEGVVMHESVLGFAGPLEVSMIRSILPDEEPVDELSLRDLTEPSLRGVTMQLNPATVHALVELLGQAAHAAEQLSA